MATEMQFCTTIPVEPGSDIEQLRWLARESFENTAAKRGMRVHDYTETVVSPLEIPDKAAKHLPRPIYEYEWYRFEAVGRVDDVALKWAAAESKWRTGEVFGAKSV